MSHFLVLRDGSIIYKSGSGGGEASKEDPESSKGMHLNFQLSDAYIFWVRKYVLTCPGTWVDESPQRSLWWKPAQKKVCWSSAQIRPSDVNVWLKPLKHVLNWNMTRSFLLCCRRTASRGLWSWHTRHHACGVCWRGSFGSSTARSDSRHLQPFARRYGRCFPNHVEWPTCAFQPTRAIQEEFQKSMQSRQDFFCFPAHWKWSCSFWSVYGLCGGLVMQEQRQWKRRNRRVDVCMRHVYTQDAVYPNTTGRWCKRTCWDCEGTSVIVFDVLDVPRDRTVWVQKNFFDNTFQILSDSCSKPKNDNVIAIAQMATSLRTFYHPYPKDSSTTMNKQYLQQAWISHSII